MEAAVYTPALEYTITDRDTGDSRAFRGHQVGQFVVRNTPAFQKRTPAGVEWSLDPWSVEHWRLGTGVLSLVRFEAALFVATELDAAAGSEPFADVDHLFVFLRAVAPWMSAQAFAARYAVPLVSLAQFNTIQQGASA
jgi:hypothetical protein